MRWGAEAVAAAVALGVLAGCGGGAAGADVAVRDSAGIRIVEVGGPPAEPAGWTVAAEPRVLIGGAAENEASQLYRVAGAGVRSDGRIVVVNAGTNEVRLYEADGRPAGSFGRSGGGPGEFGFPQLVGLLPGDSALIYDQRHSRFTVLTPEMTLGRLFSASRQGTAAQAYPQALLAGGPIVASGGVTFDPSMRSGPVDASSQLYTLSLEGEVTDSLGVFPGRSSYLKVDGGSIHFLSIPFGPETHFAAAGDRLHLGTGHAYDILSFAPDGSLARILRAPTTPRPVTDADVQRHVEAVLARIPERARPGQRRLYDELPMPEHMPAHAEIVADAAGFLWVAEYRAGPEAPHRWAVYDPEGRPVGAVETPHGVEIEAIGVDHILGRGEDDLERPYVAIWDLDRGGRPADPEP